ncbi:MAG: hypothetical protein IJW42_06210 [Alistipes sp.]|nr:hypothetical protein [Alistipes sp.]
MKKLLLFTVPIVLLSSCGTSKRAIATANPIELAPSREQVVSLEGETVIKEVRKDNGIAMSESLSEDGMSIVKVAYRWFAGTHSADNKSVATEVARREASAAVSRAIMSIVEDKAEKGALEVNGRVKEALKSYWSQQSRTILNGCEPFGDVETEYSPTTRMYTVAAKVAMRGDRFNKALQSAGTYRPETLTKEELDKFIELNTMIINAAKGE